MKSTVTTLALAVAAIVVPGASRSATAQAIMTPYQGVETLVRDVDPGRQWISDGILHIRNGRQILFDDADDPRMTGQVTVAFNVNFHLVPLPVFGHGPMWGTVRIENAGGSWVGAWVGRRTTQGHSFIRAAMKGEGGYEGLHARVDLVRRTPDLTMPLEFAGTILQSPARGDLHLGRERRGTLSMLYVCRSDVPVIRQVRPSHSCEMSP